MKKFNMKNITINDLAIMTQKGFADLEGRMDKRFDDFEERINRRFDIIEFKMGGHDRRIENLEDKMRIVNNKLGLA